MTPYQEAVRFVTEHLRPAIQNGQFVLRDTSPDRVGLQFLHGIHWISRRDELGDFEVSDGASDELLKKCESHSGAVKLLREIAAVRLFHDRPMPRGVQTYLFLHLAASERRENAAAY